MPKIFLLTGVQSSPEIRFEAAAVILAVEQRLLAVLYHLLQIPDPAVRDRLLASSLAGNR